MLRFGIWMSTIVLTPPYFAKADDKGTGTPPVDTGIGTPSPDTAGQTIVNPLKVGSLTDLLNIILDAVVQLGAIILTIALIWTGFKYVAARGNPEKIKSAHTALIWTIIGGLILLGAKSIELVIQQTVTAL